MFSASGPRRIFWGNEVKGRKYSKTQFCSLLLVGWFYDRKRCKQQALLTDCANFALHALNSIEDTRTLTLVARFSIPG